jgi:hypothetical protein
MRRPPKCDELLALWISNCIVNMELSRFHHSRSRDTQLRTRGGINLARNGVDVTWSDAKHYRTCNLSTPKVHEEPV